jgi:hypothetical protein
VTPYVQKRLAYVRDGASESSGRACR